MQLDKDIIKSFLNNISGKDEKWPVCKQFGDQLGGL